MGGLLPGESRSGMSARYFFKLNVSSLLLKVIKVKPLVKQSAFLLNGFLVRGFFTLYNPVISHSEF